MIDYAYGDIFIADGTQKDLLITDGAVTVSGDTYSVSGATVTITNAIIDSEAFELKQSLCSESQIHFGSCESGSVSFTIHDNIPTVRDKVLKVYFIPNHEASKILQIGVFKVAEDKLSADRTKRTITAYDALYDIINADVAAWYNSVLPNASSSMTLAQFRASFLSHFSITAESTTLANDSMTIKRTIEPETLSGADVIRAICEINGCFGTITNEGKFRFVVLTPGLDDGLFPSDTLYPADDLYPQDVNHDVSIMSRSAYIDVQFEDYLSEAFTQLTIRTNDEDVGVTVGTSGNRYIITGNFLVYGYNATALTTVATNAFANMENRYYRPSTVNAIGNPLHEVGDGIRIRTVYRGIVTYILQRSLKGIQALRDTYMASGEAVYNEQLNSVSSQFKQLEGKTLKLKADVDGVQAYVEEQLDSTVQGSYANITSQEIALKVAKSSIVSELDDHMSSEITITANAITFGSSGTLIVDTTNFSLDSNGNATFKGTVDAATITGGTMSGTAITSTLGGNSTTISGGTITTNNIVVTGGSISGSTITSASGSSTTTISGGSFKSEDTSGAYASIIAGEIMLAPRNYDPLWIALTASNASIAMHGSSGQIGMNYAGIVASNSGNTLTASMEAGLIAVTGTGATIKVNNNDVITTGTVYSSSNQITCASFAQLKFHSNYSGNDVTLKEILDACGL